MVDFDLGDCETRTEVHIICTHISECVSYNECQKIFRVYIIKDKVTYKFLHKKPFYKVPIVKMCSN